MNSFQAHFNSLLSIAAAGAKVEALAGGAKLGTPKAPSIKKEAPYKALEDSFTNAYMSTTGISDEGRAAVIARERSLQNLRNRTNAMRMVAKARLGELTFDGGSK